MAKPVVAIVGRPNVGKSTLFNHLIGKRKAIVEDVPGVTRDRLYDNTDWAGREFIIIDTGGIRFEEGDIFAREVKLQAELAIEEADVIVFVLDARQGLSPEDEQVADLLRRSGKPVVLAANKVENFDRQLDYYEFYKLGLGDPIPVSAMHGLNTNDLLDRVIAEFAPPKEYEEKDNAIKIAIIGRPNVGKSSLVNAFLGEQRVIVSDIPGTTRDAIDTPFHYNNTDYILIDTAGIRKKSRIKEATEKYSVIRALKSIERADVVLIMLDATEEVSEQDQRIAGYAHEAGKANIIVVNKWDLVEKDGRTMNKFDKDIREDLKFLAYAPIMYVSALTKKRIFKVLELVDFVAEQHNRRINTAELNRVVNEAMMLNPLPGGGGKKVKIYYATQVRTAPPTFVFFANQPDNVHFSYLRYLENVLRQNFGFEGSPIRLLVRQKTGKD
ncbi:MAG TPA: ribosome biogenesis GTPase Der [Syntrophomonas sp.]|jgi:GTP-binding protein|nr:ribosome biogenesis GTPase Der [Syntrophomonas sp.]